MNKKMIAIVAVVCIAVFGFLGYKEIFGAEKVVVDNSAQGQKISEYAHPESFITPVQLKNMMDENSDVVVIGALNPTKGDSPISGSFTMWRSDYSADENAYPYGGMRNTTEEMEAILSSYGATADSTIVVYSANSHHDAARLWWQIKLLGHEDVRYLDGGLNAWLGSEYPVGDANPEVAATSYVAPNPSEGSLASMDDVVEALENGTVIDTRTADEETGASTKKGAYGPGKIGDSVFIEWKKAVGEDTTLLSLDELQALYGDIEDKDVIAYCQSGVRSAHTYLVLTQALGYENVKNYDGSWIEWSYEFYENGKTELPTLNADQ